MAEITPITREEFYLAKAGGQDVPVPSAVTREEYYLEKLSNDSVVVPSPVTRREKFLYFACGGDVTLPSEDKMTRLERLIAKAGGMDVSTPTAVTRLEKFWAKVEGGWTVSTITGALPITFRSNGTALINYRIYGKADGAGVETENLVESIEQGTWSVTGFVKSNSTTRCRVGNIIDVVGSQQYTMYLECPSHNGRLNIQFKNDAGTSKGETGWQNVGAGGSYTVTVPSDATKATVILSLDSGSGNCSPANFQNIMFVQGSTVPSIHIPYGYKLPLTVTSGTESKDIDIYIGDSKLLSGDYVDYETGKIVRNGTPQDPPLPLPAIETFKGENTLDSTEALGEVTIKGKIKEA